MGLMLIPIAVGIIVAGTCALVPLLIAEPVSPDATQNDRSYSVLFSGNNDRGDGGNGEDRKKRPTTPSIGRESEIIGGIGLASSSGARPDSPFSARSAITLPSRSSSVSPSVSPFDPSKSYNLGKRSKSTGRRLGDQQERLWANNPDKLRADRQVKISLIIGGLVSAYVMWACTYMAQINPMFTPQFRIDVRRH